MSMKQNISNRAKCPFFENVLISRKSQIAGVQCLGLEGSGFDVRTYNRLRNTKELRDYVDKFCADNYESCPYYKVALMAEEI